MGKRFDGVGVDRARAPLGPLSREAAAVLGVVCAGALEAHPPAFYGSRELERRALGVGVGPSAARRGLRELERAGALVKAGGGGRGVWLPLARPTGEPLDVRPRPLLATAAEVLGALKQALEGRELATDAGAHAGRIGAEAVGARGRVWVEWELDRSAHLWTWEAKDGRRGAAGEARSGAEVREVARYLRAWAEGKGVEVLPTGRNVGAGVVLEVWALEVLEAELDAEPKPNTSHAAPSPDAEGV